MPERSCRRAVALRLVCTSRPEGVRLKDFAAHFVIFNLKPLSDEQQRQALRQQLEELSVISSKILETSKKQKSKYNFHSSGISIPRMDALEVDRVLSKKQQHSPDFQRQRSQVVRVSPNTGKAKLV